MWASLKRIKYLQLLYAAGIILIVAYSIGSAIRVHMAHTANSQPPGQAAGQNTLIELLIKPIVTSEYNIIIFRGLFYIFVWILLFLVIPVAFLRLTKFKFFNVEFEVEAERAALQNAIVTTSKASLMEYLTSRDVFVKTLGCMNGNTISFTEVVETLLADIQVAYRDTFNAGFSYAVYEDETPKKYKSLAEDSIETKKGAIWNKTHPDNPFATNLLVYHYPLSDRHYMLTVLRSYSTQFDAFDRHVLPLLHNVINNNIESIELMVAAHSMPEEVVQR